MFVLEVLMNLGLGLVLGALGGLFGIGGGLLAIPLMGVVFGMDQQLAQGTALVMVAPNVMLALWRYHQHNHIDIRHALALALPSFCCSILGSLMAISLDAGVMRIIFVLFLLVLAAYSLFQALRPAVSKGNGGFRYPWWPWFLVIGGGSGAMGGLFAVGGSLVATPLLTTLFGASQVIAQGLALSLAVPSTLVALFTYAMHGEVNWRMAIPLAIGGLITISFGVKLAHTLPERMLRMLFSGFLVVSAMVLMLKI
ncbi:sulfite exporter TauE/SafE family protein [Azomonas macrocytogenes]|uniref:Probable membrane transporter protein n=1 Tax=Azomonas macrocytogenes TaxID=69962 RepID=A0A839T4H1_AZOMA|nr:sulfite exporter TauE/SafE family protein [Azomonas macrocytogenes]MBB3103640.1 hypothetical protein [Azomonas macrocytogenes]